MSSIADGIYVITNKQSGTNLDLPGGSPTSGTKLVGAADSKLVAAYFNQNWEVRYDRDTNAYIFMNLSSGTYMDLHDGNPANGTVVWGWAPLLTGNTNNQRWLIEGPAADNSYRIVNRGSKTSMEVGGGNTAPGSGVNAWQSGNTPNQAWFFERRDRKATVIKGLLDKNPFTDAGFNHYEGDQAYILFPREALIDLCKKKGINARKWRKETYDADDFTKSMQAAVGEWAYENIKAEAALLCGMMYGTPTIGGVGNHAYNWTPTHDWSSIVFFEPQAAKYMEDTGYKAYFGQY